MGVASLVLGIVSLALVGTGCLGFIAPIPAFIGLVLGVIDLVLRRKQTGGKAKPIVGVVLSGVAMAVVIAMLVASDFQLTSMQNQYDPFGQGGFGSQPAGPIQQPQPVQPPGQMGQPSQQPSGPMQPMQPMQPAGQDTDEAIPIPVQPVQ